MWCGISGLRSQEVGTREVPNPPKTHTPTGGRYLRSFPWLLQTDGRVPSLSLCTGPVFFLSFPLLVPVFLLDPFFPSPILHFCFPLLFLSPLFPLLPISSPLPSRRSSKETRYLRCTAEATERRVCFCWPDKVGFVGRGKRNTVLAVFETDNRSMLGQIHPASHIPSRVLHLLY